jgi:hypothetical protein
MKQNFLFGNYFLISKIASRVVFLAFWVMMIGSCSKKTPFSGFHYDPVGSADTRTKAILPPQQSVFVFPKSGIRFSAQFPGGRLSDVEMINDSVYRLLVVPEFVPVNNSAWFAFSVSSNKKRNVFAGIQYSGGKHRYKPKISTDGTQWRLLPASLIHAENDSLVWLQLPVGADSLVVAAQELRTSVQTRKWIENLPVNVANVSVIGKSVRGKSLFGVSIKNNTKPKLRMLLIGRQHPPEISGHLALEAFVETIVDSSALSNRFRNHVETLVVPLANPDGADAGHWRLNGGGADLNRDWNALNQPETQQIARYFSTKLSKNQKIILALDFHSTQANEFYPINSSVSRPHGDLVFPMIETLRAAQPNYIFRAEAFDLSGPIFKNWAYKSFKADGLTYEVGDETDRETLREAAKTSARILMERILIQYGF